MDTLLKCPRCGSFVQPTWPSCKICGYDPTTGEGRELLVRPKQGPVRATAGEWVGGLLTLLVIVGIVGGIAYAGRYVWEHHEVPVNHQEYVAIAK
jgi:hypothetical protein